MRIVPLVFVGVLGILLVTTWGLAEDECIWNNWMQDNAECKCNGVYPNTSCDGEGRKDITPQCAYPYYYCEDCEQACAFELGAAEWLPWFKEPICDAKLGHDPCEFDDDCEIVDWDITYDWFGPCECVDL